MSVQSQPQTTPSTPTSPTFSSKNLDQLGQPGDETLTDHPPVPEGPEDVWESMELSTSAELRHDLTQLDASIRELMVCRVRSALKTSVNPSVLEQLQQVQRDAERRVRSIKRELVRRHPYSGPAQQRDQKRQEKLLLKTQKESFVREGQFRKEQFRARRDRHAALVKGFDFFHDYQARVGEIVAYLKTYPAVSVDTTHPPAEEPAVNQGERVASSDRV